MSLLVADYDQSADAHGTTALDNLGDTLDLDNLVFHLDLISIND